MSPQLNGTSLEEAHSEPSLKPPAIHKSQVIKNETIRDTQRDWVPSSADDYAQLAVRNLVMDMCMQNGGGHGGSALGMAAIGVALWKYVMRYNPSNPDWFDRDRFVLSNGHASMFLYVMNHLVGYENWTMDELKGYGAAKTNGYTTISHGHPEIEVPGIEVTTGPLGQGIANAVGLAIASKNLAANFNEASLQPLVQSRIYCMTGDGCLMEGVALEAISLAGHLQLDNLVLLYDDNQVTCDGPLDWINSEDIDLKMRASGWEVINVANASYDVEAIVAALRFAKFSKGKPFFIHCHTVIGVDTQIAGTYKAHHGAFDSASIARLKRLACLPDESTHVVSSEPLQFFRERKTYGKELESRWHALKSRYEAVCPQKAAELQSRIDGSQGNWLEILDSAKASEFEGLATREINGNLLEKLWAANPALCGGGADLVNSNKISYSVTDVFHPMQSHKGRYLRNGIREHAMASIANGLAAYNPSTFLPITATFFMFYIYAAPGVRMGALSHLPVIHIATHDSFAEGQNGPTHQPVELDSLYRAMPNLTYFRPCDGEELVGAWKVALENHHGPSMLSIARDPVGSVPNTDRSKIKFGAYVIVENASADITLVSCGTNLHYVVAAAESLRKKGISSRLVSAPSLGLFDQQSQQYKETVFLLDGKPIISVEEYVATVWARYTTASIGMTGYGYSASNPSNYAKFGLDARGIEEKVTKYLDELGGGNARMYGWRQL
ncbi:Transketolase, thiamine diphosphate binding domain-containing protein [Rhexocercosporidium sp. MPI-PUGE-AT-0058]|nr:Transketolase, thiamine diphosphate binding domain-containing protein [Rhexocercosporidium sp. MPI-PUGE-AT-0058]